VKSVLQKLFEVYDKNWKLIKHDNYRTLLDVYFQSKEDKVLEHYFLTHRLDTYNHSFGQLYFLCLDMLPFLSL